MNRAARTTGANTDASSVNGLAASPNGGVAILAVESLTLGGYTNLAVEPARQRRQRLLRTVTGGTSRRGRTRTCPRRLPIATAIGSTCRGVGRGRRRQALPPGRAVCGPGPQPVTKRGRCHGSVRQATSRPSKSARTSSVRTSPGNIDIEKVAETEDGTPVGATVTKELFTGITTSPSFTVDGPYDDTATTGPDAVFGGGLGTTRRSSSPTAAPRPRP